MTLIFLRVMFVVALLGSLALAIMLLWLILTVTQVMTGGTC